MDKTVRDIILFFFGLLAVVFIVVVLFISIDQVTELLKYLPPEVEDYTRAGIVLNIFVGFLCIAPAWIFALAWIWIASGYNRWVEKVRPHANPDR